MLAGTISLALNAISITRTGEKDNPTFTEKIHLAKAAAGPARRIGVEHVMGVCVIWKFAENTTGAKKFLVDYVGNFRQVFINGEFYDFPTFQRTGSDLNHLLTQDAKAKPADKYKVLEDVLNRATNVGRPGYANEAIDEAYQKWIINAMLAKVAQGVLSPEDAVKEGNGMQAHLGEVARAQAALNRQSSAITSFAAAPACRSRFCRIFSSIGLSPASPWARSSSRQCPEPRNPAMRGGYESITTAFIELSRGKFNGHNTILSTRCAAGTALSR